jgi:hypothetical protein
VPSASKITGPLGMAIAVVLSCKKKKEKRKKNQHSLKFFWREVFHLLLDR